MKLPTNIREKRVIIDAPNAPYLGIKKRFPNKTIAKVARSIGTVKCGLLKNINAKANGKTSIQKIVPGMRILKIATDSK